MSKTIKILPEQLANKIAAGEVVQRPASAVKELIENSIDAHANSITIIIEAGGKTLIRVIDDGDGMSAEDASMAFARHATSKISTYEDLECIRTMGFRGEALAAVAAVAQVEMRTRRVASDVGTKVRVDGGAGLEVVEDVCPVGTSIQIRNLFFNTPGRRNFLKSTSTEYKHIFDVIQRVAISHRELTIKFLSDNETILSLQPASQRDRLKDLFGEKMAETLITITETTEQGILSGFLGKPDYGRKGRSEQYLYLNRRFILSRNINHAVFQAYEHLIEKGSFPVFILFLSLDPKRVDVNVHPTKMEVKFEDESLIYRTVFSAVRKSLGMHDLIPGVEVNAPGHKQASGEMKFRLKSIPSQQRAATWQQLYHPIVPGTTKHPVISVDQHDEVPLKPEVLNAGSQAEIPQTISLWGRAWQLANQYIVVTINEGLMIIDQHAAHERVLYEQIQKRFTQHQKNSQQLLFPQTVQVTAGDAALLKSLLTDLERLGFSLRLFGAATFILDGVPPEVKPGSEATILQDIIDLYKEDEQRITLEPGERLAKSFACRTAVKAGDPLGEKEIASLVEQLFRSEIPYVCPHGRPVSIKLSLSELDRRFGRTT